MRADLCDACAFGVVCVAFAVELRRSGLRSRGQRCVCNRAGRLLGGDLVRPSFSCTRYPVLADAAMAQ